MVNDKDGYVGGRGPHPYLYCQRMCKVETLDSAGHHKRQPVHVLRVYRPGAHVGLAKASVTLHAISGEWYGLSRDGDQDHSAGENSKQIVNLMLRPHKQRAPLKRMKEGGARATRWITAREVLNNTFMTRSPKTTHVKKKGVLAENLLKHYFSRCQKSISRPLTTEAQWCGFRYFEFHLRYQ